MAGIAGYFGHPKPPEVLQGMVRKLAHRGRGGEAFYASSPVFMGVRGTAEQVAAQPVYSRDDSISVLFSGSLTNEPALRDDLGRKGIQFRGDSTAELVLHLYEAYGLNMTSHLNGRFAFAVHDMLKDFVFIARDRLGQEPLFYTTTQSGAFVFASEAKALFEHPGVQAFPDMRSIDAYLTLGFSPGPGSFFKGIHKLPAGHRIIWNPGLHVMVEPYWQWETFALPDATLKSDADFQARFGQLLGEGVAQSLQGLRRPAVRLNGSLEDSAVAYALKAQGGVEAESFSVGFDDGDGAFAAGRDISRRLGLRHHEIVCTPPDMEKMPEIIWALDEPTADLSALTTYMLAQRASQHVDGVLTGAGAGELMAGLLPQEVFLHLSRASGFSSWLFKLQLGIMPLPWLEKQFDCFGRLGEPSRERLVSFMAEKDKQSPLMRQYAHFVSVFTAREKGRFYSDTFWPFMETYIDAQKPSSVWEGSIGTLVALQKDYALQDALLMPVDRACAMTEMQVRMPFVDHRMAEFLLSLPDRQRYRDGRGKALLRNYIKATVPDLPPETTRRAGAFPLLKFMSTRLMRDMIDTCLSEQSIRRRGMFKEAVVRDMVIRAREGDMLQLRQVYALLMLELWFRIYIDHEKGWITS